MNSSSCKTSLFRHTRKRMRSRLGLDHPEQPLEFSEPEHVDREDWDRAYRRMLKKDVLPRRMCVA